MTATTSAGPTALRERALGPDLARGVMLLFIALANSHYFLPGGPSSRPGPEVFGGFPQDGGGVDRAVSWVIATFIDGRAFPMFGFLFGYGVARIVARQAPTNTIGAVRRLLWRRSSVLIALGFAHGLLLFVGDILAAYGVLLLVGAWAIGWKDRTLLWVAGALFVLCALPSLDSGSISPYGPDASMLSPDPFTQLQERPPVQAWIAFLGPIGFACPFLVGLWAGRRQVLEFPEQHRRLLAWTAGLGLTAAIVGAQPAALIVSRVNDRPGDDALSLIGPLHDATGVLGGFGYAALIALVAAWLVRSGRADGRTASGDLTTIAKLVGEIAATGQRSMTCYLAQSPVWFVVFTPYLLGLAGHFTITTTALLAIVTWSATVLLASRLAAAGNRGPFETLTRRVTYGGWRSLGASR